MSARPRQTVFRGVVGARGVRIATDVIGEANARRRVVAMWEAGCTVHAIVRRTEGARKGTHGYVVRFARERVHDSERDPGAPLVEQQGRWLALPLEDAELRAIGDATGIFRAAAGCVVVEDPVSRVEPADWLELALTPVRVTALAPPPRAPELVLEPPTFDAREKIPGAPPRTGAMAALIAGIAARKAARQTGSSPPLSGAFAALRSLLDSVVAALRPANDPSGSPATPRQPGWWRRSLARLGLTAGLARLVGHQHAAYLKKMLERFDEGDLDGFLRRAIPLGDLVGAGLDRFFPFLGWLVPRNDLSLDLRGGTLGAGIGLSLDFMGFLNQRYRDAFTRLEQAGRIEEAAFVLTELLGAHEEAVLFLERHGRLRLAAELAEARTLAPGLVVRMWFLAGDATRAVRIAITTGAFADAVQRLEKDHPERAAELRALWATRLAEAGDHFNAVEVLWPVLAERDRARPWIEAAIAGGGEVAARMQARKLTLVPESFPEVRAAILMLAASDDGGRQRASAAEQLRAEPSTAATRTLLRALTRARLRDGAPWTELSTLAAAAHDSALQSDLPEGAEAMPKMLAARTRPFLHTVAASDRGAIPIYDAALLANGDVVCALGESGIRFLARDGRVRQHLDVPAHQLVLSDSGNRAIGVADRGAVRRLAKVDLIARTARDWCDARLVTFATTYDGSVWIAAGASEVMAFDAIAERLEALWRVGDLPLVTSIARSSQQISFRSGDEIWIHDRRGFTLRERRPLARERVSELLALEPDGNLLCAANGSSNHDRWIEIYGTRTRTLRIGDDASPGHIMVDGEWCVVIAIGVDATHRAHLAITSGALPGARASFVLEGAERVGSRIHAGSLTIFDDRGRILVLDLETGDLLRDLRLR